MVNIVTVTQKSVMVNYDCNVATNVSTQEKANMLMILHALEIEASGDTVHIYTQDTDVLLLALRRVPQLCRHAALIMGTGDHCHAVLLQPIYDALALINWHALTRCETTGNIRGKGKVTCFNTFMAAKPSVISALINLGLGDEPSTKVTDGCEAFLCVLFCPPRVKVSQAKDLRWLLFKQMKPDQGVDKLPPTPGSRAEHIRRAHLQENIRS